MEANAEQRIAELAGRFLPDVEHCLREALEAGGELAPMLRYHLGWETLEGTPTRGGGKTLRPILCLAACEMSGGDWRDALPAAAALELIHNFSLIHDDIQDGDETRRGTPTLWRIWGVPSALTMGNTMRVIADRTADVLSTRGVTPDIAHGTVSELTRRYLEMIEGQYLDLSFETAGARLRRRLPGHDQAQDRCADRKRDAHGRAGRDRRSSHCAGVRGVRDAARHRLPGARRLPRRVGRPSVHRQGGGGRHPAGRRNRFPRSTCSTTPRTKSGRGWKRRIVPRRSRASGSTA